MQTNDPYGEPVGQCSATWLIVDYVTFRAYSSALKCLTSRYFIANIFYLFYSSCMIYVDFIGTDIGERRLQTVFVQFALLHIFIALLYFYMWIGENQKIFSIFLLPDWLNLLGSLFYLSSACLYPYQFDASGARTSYFNVVQSLEFLAAIIEFLAAIFWIVQWYVEYCKDLVSHPESTIGKLYYVINVLF